jgi:lipopolysaccharide/colanic/teichoic acid biosynthesis glycosyltransferase
MYRWNAVTRNANNGSRLVEFERFSFLPAKARNQDTGIKTLLLDRLPNLVNVVRGEMGFVGPKPKSLAELDSIPPSWRELYLEARPGIISEAELILGPDAEAEELYAVEAVYSVTRHGLRDFKLGIDYLRRSLLGRNLAV